MGLLRWGLVPSWAKEPELGSRLINARSETVAEKPAFKGAFRRRRCLVPADGYFEWRKDEAEKAGRPAKTPYWIHREGRRPLALAGLWEKWEPRDGSPLYTFAILTTEAAAAFREIHPRMPVILPQGEWARWLKPGAVPEELLPMLRPYQGEDLRAYPVSTLVNSPRNDLPACVEPV
jgi:putative SOS response-associated peptidase YedK